MISIDNKSAKQTLDHYLLHYRDIFNKRSFLLFKWLIAAILCVEEVRSIQFLYDNFILFCIIMTLYRSIRGQST